MSTGAACRGPACSAACYHLASLRTSLQALPKTWHGPATCAISTSASPGCEAASASLALTMCASVLRPALRSALAHLASASGVSREREEFMELVEKEIDRWGAALGA